MAETLPLAARSAEPLSARRARVMRHIEETRSDIAVEWTGFEAAVAGGEQRSRAVMATIRNGAKWALALTVLWILGRRRTRLSWPRAAMLAALARMAARLAFRHWYRGERHVEP
jgi:hypothetical protein